MNERKPYASDVSDDEWECIAPYLQLLPEDVSQRRYDLREVYNAVRYLLRTGIQWRMMPHDLPPWEVVYQQLKRWKEAECFENAVHDLRLLLREAKGRKRQPTAAILDSRTIQSTPESGGHAGYDAGKKRTGSKAHIAVDTQGYVMAVHVTPANEQDRAQVGPLTEQIQTVTAHHVQVAFVDQGYTGEDAATAAASHGIRLDVVKRPEGSHGFVLLPRRWVVERSFGWVARFRRLARDYERLLSTVASFHFAAFGCLMLHQWISKLSP
jgi:transposase